MGGNYLQYVFLSGETPRDETLGVEYVCYGSILTTDVSPCLAQSDAGDVESSLKSAMAAVDGNKGE